MLGGNPISKACKQNICTHFHFIVVFLFPIKRKELTLTLCIIFAFFYSNNRESCQGDRGEVTGEKNFLKGFDPKAADYLQAVSVEFMVLRSMHRSADRWGFAPQLTPIKI